MFKPATISALRGAYELFLGRKDGLQRFDWSVDGFWHSFTAILFILPLFAIDTAVEHRLMAPDLAVSDGIFLLDRIVDFGLDWIAMPILLALAVKPMKLGRRYVPYIVVRNWALILMSAPQALISLLLGFGLLTIETSAILSLAILGVMFHYHFRIVRWTLGVSVPIAIGFVAADIALSLILRGLIDWVFGL